MSLPTLYTATEVAEHLNISDRHVRALVQSGQLHAYRFGRSIRISSEAVTDYLSASSTLSAPVFASPEPGGAAPFSMRARVAAAA